MSETFDQLTRQIGQAKSRREALRLLGTGLLGVALGSLVGKKALAADPAGMNPNSLRGLPPQPFNPGLPPARFDPRQPLGPPITFPPGSGPRPIPLEPVGKTCSSAMLTSCLADVEFQYSVCAIACNTGGIFSCGPGEQYPNPPRTVGCQQCRSQRPDCQYTLQQGAAECQKLYGCAQTYSCVQDEVRPLEYCCRMGTSSCRGMCVAPCQSLLQRRNRQTCQCECATHCRPPLIQGADCTCKCPECRPGFRLQDPRTCKCSCIEGLTLCGDECVSLQVNRKHCGACGTECAPGEECCSGQCASLHKDPNCGGCSRNCSARGMTCCTTRTSGGTLPNAYCSDLNHSFDCGECGRSCASGCCAGVCCNGLMSGCCNGRTCTSLNTCQNCGSCGNRCASDEACCNGVRTKLGTNDNCATCGNVCLQASPWVDVATGVHVTTVNSSCKNRSCSCPPNSAICDNLCAPEGWYCNGHASDGRVLLARCPNGNPTGQQWGTGAVICCTRGFDWVGNSRVCR